MMPLQQYFMKEAETCSVMLDYDEYPQLTEYLNEYANGMIQTWPPYEFAAELLSLDEPKELPDEVLHFIHECYEIAIKDRNGDAIYQYGCLYDDGYRGFEQDSDIAMEYYELAAECGSGDAQETLGYHYYYGKGGKVDYEKAFHYFSLGAFEGHIVSQYKIGDMYLNGYYVKKNESEAFRIYVHCVDNMPDEAAARSGGPLYLRLGNLFLNGTGTEKNLFTALYCFQRAEYHLFQMVKDGDERYRSSLEAAIQGHKDAESGLLDDINESSSTNIL